jgi:hypothetical protein
MHDPAIGGLAERASRLQSSPQGHPVGGSLGEVCSRVASLESPLTCDDAELRKSAIAFLAGVPSRTSPTKGLCRSIAYYYA